MNERSLAEKKLIKFGLIIVGIVVMVMSPQSLDAFNYPKQMFLASGALSLFCLSIFYARAHFLVAIKQPFGILLTALFLTLIISTSFHGITSTQIFWGTFSRANGFLTYASMILLCITLYSNVQAIKYVISKVWIPFVILLTSISLSYGLLQFIGLDPIPWNNPHSSVIGTFGNPNFSSAAYSIFAILNISLIFYFWNSWPKSLFFVGLSLLSIFLIIATKSFQGVAGVFAGIAVFLGFLILRLINRKVHQFLFLLFALGFSSPIAFGIFGQGPLRSYLYQDTVELRINYWNAALGMMRDNLLTGVGNDSYGDYFREYRTPEFVMERSAYLVTNNAHNVILQSGATIGLPYMAALIAIYTLTLIHGAYFLYKLASKVRLRDYYFYLGIFSSWCSLSLISLFSIDQLGVSVFWWTLTGVLNACFRFLEPSDFDASKSYMSRKAVKTKATKQKNPATSIFVLLYALLIPAFSFFFRADLELRDAIQIPNSGEKLVYEKLRGDSISAAASDLVMIQDYANYAIRSLYESGPAPIGLEVAKEAVLLNPRNSAALELLAAGYEFYGNLQEAEITYQRILQIDPFNYVQSLKFAKLAIRQGDFETARRELLKVTELGDEASVKEARALIAQL